MGERPEHVPTAWGPLLVELGSGQNPLWQLPEGLFCAHLPPWGTDASFGGQRGAQEGPACSSSSSVGQCVGAAASCSARTSAPSLQGAVVKEIAGCGDIGLVEDHCDPPVFEANTLLIWQWMLSGAARSGGLVIQLCTCCVRRALSRGQPPGETLVHTGVSGSCWGAGPEPGLGRGKYCGTCHGAEATLPGGAVKPGHGEGKGVPVGPFSHVWAPTGTSETSKGFENPNTLFRHQKSRLLITRHVDTF